MSCKAFGYAQNEERTSHIVVFFVFLFVGWGWVLNVIDLIYMVLTGHLILGD